MTHRIRLQVEPLEDRCTPSGGIDIIPPPSIPLAERSHASMQAKRAYQNQTRN